MAITSNGLGKFSGKLGGAVFVIRNGKQIVREYNPRPSNPKSALQLQQRAKGNLAGRISSFVPKAAIAGLGVNGIRRRSRFNQLLLKAATVSLIGDDYKAKIGESSILFSEGTVISPFALTSLVASANNLDVSLRGLSVSAIDENTYSALNARLVVMVYDTISQDLVEVSTRIANKPQQGADAVTRMPIVHPSGYMAAAYLVPMSSVDGSAVAIDAGLAGKEDADIAALLGINSNAIVFNYGRSIFLGSTNFVPSTTSAAPSDERKRK